MTEAQKITLDAMSKFLRPAMDTEINDEGEIIVVTVTNKQKISYIIDKNGNWREKTAD